MPQTVEWPTLAMVALCYALWGAATVILPAASMPLAIAVAALAIALHSSLSHEVLHGHPFRWQPLNEALVAPALALFIPYGRFRDTHLDHHRDEQLTDPYDDPESNYLDPAAWQRLPRPVQQLLRINNTLAGRILLGPAIGLISFFWCERRLMRSGDARVLRGWLGHLPGLMSVALWLGLVAQMPVWAYLIAVYAALSILKIRTFLEHQAHERASGRTVIIEDRGPLAWMFLNNNLHVVHHMHPKVAWYRLPALYGAQRARYLRRNGGYVYRSYAQVFGRHFLKAKDPVPHPLRPS